MCVAHTHVRRHSWSKSNTAAIMTPNRRNNHVCVAVIYRLSRSIRHIYNQTKIGKVVDQLQPLPRCAKKVGELWSINKKVIGANVDPPELNFSRDYISARSGCWPLKFLHSLEIDQGLLAHTPGGLTLGSAPHF